MSASFSMGELQDCLMAEQSRKQCDWIIAMIGDSKEYYEMLLSCISPDHPSLARRAAWVVEILDHQEPHRAQQYYEVFKKILQKNDATSIDRSLLSLFAREMPLPENDWVFWIDLCCEKLNDPATPIAVKAHAMQIFAKIAQHEKELIPELLFLLEPLLANSSPALKSRAAKIRQQLLKA